MSAERHDSVAKPALCLPDVDTRYFVPFEGMPIPVHSMAPDGLLKAVNQAWVDYTGHARERAVGRSFAAFLDPASAERYRLAAVPEMVTAVAAGQSRSVEYVLVKASGEQADIVLTARPIRDGAGRFLHSLSVISDITARNRAEAALRAAQKLEAIGALTSGVAHDFNNLLMIIQGSLQLLSRHLPPHDRHAARLVDAALQGTNRGAALTARLLAFARQQELAPQPIEPEPFLAALRPILAQLLGAEIQITHHIHPGTAALSADPDQLQLALLNLATNARDAMNGTGTLHIGVRNVLIDTAKSAFIDGITGLAAGHPALVRGAYVVISVTDTGAGMDDTVLARAADPFFTTKGIGKGTGLGLSMVHGFVAQSGGAMQITSRPGIGTTVDLWLPSTEARAPIDMAATRPDDAPALAAGNRQLRILLVDDDPLVRAGTTAMLEELGQHVHAVASGNEALATLREGAAVDLLLTDYMMPGMSGAQLAAQARALRPDLPVLLASGFAELDPAAVGLWPRLRKPYTLTEMGAALAAVTCR
jgi:PAS domain S-box-containing protein